MRVDTLKKLGACKPAVEWAKHQKSYQQAWDNCTNPFWMLWILIKKEGKQYSMYECHRTIRKISKNNTYQYFQLPLNKRCDVIRKHYPNPPKFKLK